MRKRLLLAVPAVLIAATASIAPSTATTTATTTAGPGPIGTFHNPLRIPAPGHHRYASFNGYSKTFAAAQTNTMTLAQASKDLAFPVADDQIKRVRFVSSHNTLTVRVWVPNLHKATEANGTYTSPSITINDNDGATDVYVAVDAKNHVVTSARPDGMRISVIRGINGSVTFTIPRDDFPAKEKSDQIEVDTETDLTKTDGDPAYDTATVLADWGSTMRSPYRRGVYVDTH